MTALFYNPRDVYQALQSLVAASNANPARDTYYNDLVSVSVQVLSDVALQVHFNMVYAFNHTGTFLFLHLHTCNAYTHTRLALLLSPSLLLPLPPFLADKNGLNSYSTQFLGLIDDMESVLRSNEDYLLGTWIRDARYWGHDQQEQ